MQGAKKVQGNVKNVEILQAQRKFKATTTVVTSCTNTPPYTYALLVEGEKAFTFPIVV